MRTFLLGAAGYPLLELLWRRRTHYSMALAGGISAVLIQRISRLKTSTACKAILSGAGITAVEAVCGFIWNRRYKIWDYRRIPFQWHGQICLPYTLLWCGLSAVCLHGMKMLDQMKTGRTS